MLSKCGSTSSFAGWRSLLIARNRQSFAPVLLPGASRSLQTYVPGMILGAPPPGPPHVGVLMSQIERSVAPGAAATSMNRPSASTQGRNAGGPPSWCSFFRFSSVGGLKRHAAHLGQILVPGGPGSLARRRHQTPRWRATGSWKGIHHRLQASSPEERPQVSGEHATT